MLAKSAQGDVALWPPSMLGSVPERRCRPRLKLALPVVLFRSVDSTSVETKTENISCDSFYCVSERPFSLDERLDCELLIPDDEATSIPEGGLRLYCQVRVVRVVPRGFQLGYGVACVLEDYTISRS